jgi:hypothetical protein
MKDGWEFDSVGFADELQERVVEPMMEAQEILDRHDYMTRMYSTVSPDEMTRDPLFHFNPELPDVSNQHNAEAVGSCSDDGTLDTVVITLENGESFTVDGPDNFWWGGMSDVDWTDPAPEEGAASSVSLVGEEGEPVSIKPEDVKTIDARLDDEDPSMVLSDLQNGIIEAPADDPVDPDPEETDPPVDPVDEEPVTPTDPPVDDIGDPTPEPSPASTPSSDDGGCGGSPSPLSWWPALAGMLLLFRRRQA